MLSEGPRPSRNTPARFALPLLSKGVSVVVLATGQSRNPRNLETLKPGLRLLVPQRFDWIQPCRLDCGNHAAQQAHEPQDQRGRYQSGGVDGQVNVAFR